MASSFLFHFANSVKGLFLQSKPDNNQMRKFTLLFAFITLSLVSCSDDSDESTEDPIEEVPDCILDESVYLTTQAEVDAFAELGYCKVGGILQIGPEEGLSDIHNISGLSGLDYVGSSLVIRNNPELPDLSGLENITKVQGALSIRNNDMLVNLEGLSGLQTIGSSDGSGGSHIALSQNDAMVDFSGLGDVEAITLLELFFNDSLESLNGLQGLEVIGVVGVVSCPAFESFTGLENVTVAESIHVNSHSLLSIEALSGLVALESFVCSNSLLTSLESLEGITNLRALSLFNNEYLESLEGLENLTEVKSLIIDGNDALSSIAQLSGVTKMKAGPGEDHAYMRIDSNGSLESLEGLQNINIFVGDLDIHSNNVLKDLCALQSLLAAGEFTYPTIIEDNYYNPTPDDIIEGNCSIN